MKGEEQEKAKKLEVLEGLKKQCMIVSRSQLCFIHLVENCFDLFLLLFLSLTVCDYM